MGRRRHYKERETITKSDLAQPQLLDCPSCHHFIGSHEVHMDKGIAKCTNCDHVFSFQEFIEEDPIGRTAYAELPVGVDVLNLKSLLEIRISHFSSRGGGFGFAGIFAIMWNIFLIPMLWMIISSGDWFALLFLSLHLFAGIGMLRNFIGTLFNKTMIELSGFELSYHTAPFGGLFNSNTSIPRDEISHFTISASHRKFKSSGSKALYVHLKNGKRQLIIDGVNKSTLAYTKDQLDRALSD